MSNLNDPPFSAVLPAADILTSLPPGCPPPEEQRTHRKAHPDIFPEQLADIIAEQEHP